MRLFCVAVLSALFVCIASVHAQQCVENPDGQWNCTGAIVSDDANAGNLPNQLLMIENYDADVTPLSQCTATESNVPGKHCCVFHDADKTANLVPGWRCGSAWYPLSGADVLDVRGYGAVCDGTTDDTAAVSAAISAATSGQGVRLCAPSTVGALAITTTEVYLLLPAGAITQTDTWTFTSLYGGGILGQGIESQLVWDGAQGKPAIAIVDCQDSRFEQFKLEVNTGKVLDVGIALWNDSSLSAVSPRSRTFRGVIVDGGVAGASSRLGLSGIEWAAPANATCTASRAPWWCCTGSGTGSCPATSDTNNDLDSLEQVKVVNGPGSSSPFTAFKVGHSQSVGHTFINCEMRSAGYGVSNYGPTNSGHFNWFAGSGGANGTDFYLAPNAGARPITIDGWDSENSFELLDTPGPASSQQPIILRGIRWNPDAAASGNIVSIRNRGPLTLSSNRLGLNSTSTTIFADISGSNVANHSATNNLFKTTASAPLLTVGNDDYIQWELTGNLQDNGGTITRIPDRRKQQRCIVVENLAATDDGFEFWQTETPVLVTSIGCRCRGACSTVATFTLKDRGGTGMTITGTNPTCATTGDATYAAVTANNSLVAGEGVAFDVTNSPTTGDTYTVCITYYGE